MHRRTGYYQTRDGAVDALLMAQARVLALESYLPYIGISGVWAFLLDHGGVFRVKRCRIRRIWLWPSYRAEQGLQAG